MFAALLMTLAGVQFASAQTSAVAKLAVESGNGQVACQCVTATLQMFQPITVKATDVNGAPVANATITWTVKSGQATMQDATTITDANGLSSNTPKLIILINIGTNFQPFLLSTIEASSNSRSVIFTETQSLVDTHGSAMITADFPTLNGQILDATPLVGNTGTQMIQPIKVHVAGQGLASGGVANVSVRLVAKQSSPSFKCAAVGGTSADPGTVLTDNQGNANCYPVFGGSGNGQFLVVVGGFPAGDLAHDNGPLAFQAYGPFNFKSIPGAPAAVQIVSGNNQVRPPAQPIDPMIAKLVDGAGNGVSDAAMTWTVVPIGGAALSNTKTTTDNSGIVSTDITLYPAAATGLTVTVSLTSNPSISAVFQATIEGAITTFTKVSGDLNSAQVGTDFPPVIVQVNNAVGPLLNFPVQFSVTGPATLNKNLVYANANGQAAVTVKAGSTAGPVTVTAVVGVKTLVFNLTVTAIPTGPVPNGIQIISGDPQSAIVNTAFTAPLIVQVDSASGPVPNYTVTFFGSSGVILSGNSATTGSNGRAQVTVTAGLNAGPASVTASIAGYSKTFNLTVLPVGPSLTADSFLNGASRQPRFISPCSIATLSANGIISDGISALSPAPIIGRLPLQVHNLSILFNNIAAPIVNVAMGPVYPEVTFQVPCEVTPGNSVPVKVNVGAGSTTINTAVSVVSPGIFETVMSDGVKRAVVVRDDGTFADIGTLFPNPARRNETVRIFVTGLGPTIPAVGTNSIQNPNADLLGRDAQVAGTVQVGIVGLGGVQVLSSRAAPDLIGVYEVQFLLPFNAPTGNDVGISVGIIPQGAGSGSPAISSVLSKISIQ